MNNKQRELNMTFFSNNNTTMRYKSGYKNEEEYIQIHTGGHPQRTIFKGNRKAFEASTGIIVFDKRGMTRLSVRQMKKLNDLLNKTK
tara:strand:- start:123 stop:383 length:261 start_codon:yes stop_codon:yes gene_type:complete